MDLPAVTDDTMRELLGIAKEYCIVVLHRTPLYADSPETPAIVWEHARRNFALRQAGLLAIVCPIRDDTDVSGVGIFSCSLGSVQDIMADDPGVRAGIFTYEAHTCRGFPGDSLPA